MKELVLYNSDLSLLIASIHVDGSMVNLTDLWKAAGSPKNKELKDWLRLPGTIDFIESTVKKLKVEKSHLLIIKRGRSGGTWAHQIIGLHYAGYLSTDIEVAFKQIVIERAEEIADPEKAITRAIKTYERKGKDGEWIETRVKGIVSRNSYTHTLSLHGVQRNGYRDCTNAIYTPLFGGTTSVVRQKKGLNESVNIRDNLTVLELRSIEFSELLAKENIEKNKLTGNAQCEVASRHAAKSVANSIIQAIKPQ